MSRYDLIIRGGFVVDGTGLPRRRVDVGVRDGRVAALARLDGEDAREEIDADGRIVAPGIVDAHTHYDPQITFDPYATMSCFHGVTTVVAGNCGFSVAPCKPDDREFLAGIFARVENMDPVALSAIGWDDCVTFPQFLETRRGRLGVNFACYVGHSNLRRWVMGADASERTARDDEVDDHAGDARRGHGGRRGRAVVVGRPHPPRSRRPPGAVAPGQPRRARGARRRGRPQRRGLDRVPARERDRRHRRRRRGLPHPARRGERAAGRHPGPGRPQQDRCADRDLGGVARVPRPRHRGRRARLLHADRPAVRPPDRDRRDELPLPRGAELEPDAAAAARRAGRCAAGPRHAHRAARRGRALQPRSRARYDRPATTVEERLRRLRRRPGPRRSAVALDLRSRTRARRRARRCAPRPRALGRPRHPVPVAHREPRVGRGRGRGAARRAHAHRHVRRRCAPGARRRVGLELVLPPLLGPGPAALDAGGRDPPDHRRARRTARLRRPRRDRPRRARRSDGVRPRDRRPVEEGVRARPPGRGRALQGLGPRCRCHHRQRRTDRARRRAHRAPPRPGGAPRGRRR